MPDLSGYITAAKVIAKVIAIIVPAIVGAIIAVKTAITDAAARSQANKNKAEAGYQLTRQALEALEARQAQIEQELRALKTAPPAAAAKHAPVHKALPPPAIPPPPHQLPSDLDKAERQVYRQSRGPSIEPLPAASVETGQGR